ncbi:MAG: hypothetical protein AB3N18_14205 [Allomuricauda sp.]
MRDDILSVSVILVVFVIPAEAGISRPQRDFSVISLPRNDIGRFFVPSLGKGRWIDALASRRKGWFDPFRPA